MTVHIIHGDCVVEMAKLLADSFDSIVCDPPYGLEFMGREWDKFVEKPRRIEGTGGLEAPFAAHAVALTPSRNRNFQEWCSTWTQEAYRVLKPGGYIVAFGGTRTFHRLACSIEDSGFEIRDCLTWLYGSGFPKSTDVSKQIDKHAGAERKVTGSKITGNAKQKTNKSGEIGSWANGNTSGQQVVDVTEPETEDAKRWSGWGTNLKPAWEPIILARKPISETTIATNVLKHGTGAINIDATRINDGNGRWPANLVLSHSPGCVITGQRQVKARVINRFDDGAKPFGNGAGHAYTSEPFGDENGNETIDIWNCVEYCSVRLLDEQSGDRPSGNQTGQVFGPKYSNGVVYTDSKTLSTAFGYGDNGGASRFFYSAKVAPSERNERTKQAGIDNDHPTVKPVELMRWLVRLVTRPGGHLLDPFAGSGTTLVASIMEGMDATGIELTDEYIPIIRARVDGIQIGGLFD